MTDAPAKPAGAVSTFLLKLNKASKSVEVAFTHRIHGVKVHPAVLEMTQMATKSKTVHETVCSDCGSPLRLWKEEVRHRMCDKSSDQLEPFRKLNDPPLRWRIYACKKRKCEGKTLVFVPVAPMKVKAGEPCPCLDPENCPHQTAKMQNVSQPTTLAAVS